MKFLASILTILTYLLIGCIVIDIIKYLIDWTSDDISESKRLAEQRVELAKQRKLLKQELARQELTASIDILDKEVTSFKRLKEDREQLNQLKDELKELQEAAGC